MHIKFCAKLNFLEGEYAITQNIRFLLSWVGNPCRYLAGIRMPDFRLVVLAAHGQVCTRIPPQIPPQIPALYNYIFLSDNSE